MPVHLVRRELNCDKGEVGLVCELPKTIFFLLMELFFHPGAQLKRDYLLNLSISKSGRKDIYGLVCRVVPLGDGVTVNGGTA